MSGREHGHELPPHHTAPPVAPAQSRSSDELEVVPGFERENLQGWIPQLATDADIRAVIEKAFDYRGDVTITKKDNSQLTGYLFDRRIGKTLRDSVVRLVLATSSDRPAIPYSEIAGIGFRSWPAGIEASHAGHVRWRHGPPGQRSGCW